MSSPITPTDIEQSRVERPIASLYASADPPPLDNNIHINYLLRAIECLPSGYCSLDSSRPWLVFWILQSLFILRHPLPHALADRCLRFLPACWDAKAGGFAGGPAQNAHLAPTYAAVNSVLIIAEMRPELKSRCFEYLSGLRAELRRFLGGLKDKATGAFRVTDDGEIDTRGAYTAMAVGSMLNILDADLTAGLGEWLAACQRYDGGMAGEPGGEAHGGYTFCGLAALIIINRTHLIDLPALLHWSTMRQMSVEGGFQGRTNKLVDGCYSYWVGALFPLIQMAEAASAAPSSSTPLPLSPGLSYFSSSHLSRYVLQCCQHPSGGLKDKPGKGPDLYHTCYCLAGLAIAEAASSSPSNATAHINALYNLPIDTASEALEYFAAQEKPGNQTQKTQTQTQNQ